MADWGHFEKLKRPYLWNACVYTGDNFPLTNSHHTIGPTTVDVYDNRLDTSYFTREGIKRKERTKRQIWRNRRENNVRGVWSQFKVLLVLVCFCTSMWLGRVALLNPLCLQLDYIEVGTGREGWDGWVGTGQTKESLEGPANQQVAMHMAAKILRPALVDTYFALLLAEHPVATVGHFKTYWM